MACTTIGKTRRKSRAIFSTETSLDSVIGPIQTLALLKLGKYTLRVKFNLTNLEPSRWALRRLVEFLVALPASITLIVAQYGSDQFVSAVQLSFAFLLTYAGPPLYAPLSLLVWMSSAVIGRQRWREAFDSLFFLVHGYGAMCVMYNGLWIIDRPIDPSNSMVVLWLGAAGVHATLLVLETGRIWRRAE
jgi:hypothetical protein